MEPPRAYPKANGTHPDGGHSGAKTAQPSWVTVLRNHQGGLPRASGDGAHGRRNRPALSGGQDAQTAGRHAGQGPHLYPEIAGTDEKDDDRTGDAAEVREEVVRPLLEATDIDSAFAERLEVYKIWRGSLPHMEENTDAVLAHELRLDDALAAAFEEHR